MSALIFKLPPAHRGEPKIKLIWGRGEAGWSSCAFLAFAIAECCEWHHKNKTQASNRHIYQAVSDLGLEEELDNNCLYTYWEDERVRETAQQQWEDDLLKIIVAFRAFAEDEVSEIDEDAKLLFISIIEDLWD